MRSALTFPLLLLALYVPQTVAVQAETCVANQSGDLVCGEGKSASHVFAGTISPSKAYAFAWRTPQGLPSGRVVQIPSGAGAQPVRLPGPPTSSYQVGGATELTAIIPGPGLGPMVNGQPTDMITTLQADGSFDQVRLVALPANGLSMNVDPSVDLDDGTADVVEEALPILVDLGVPALLYVATQFVEEGRDFPDEGRVASWSALADAAATGCLDLGSHTHSHALLDRLADHLVAEELDRSVELIGERTGVGARHFAYPKALAGSPAADRLVREETTLVDQLNQGFRLTTGRSPSPDELDDLTRYAEEFGLPAACRVMLNLNEFVFVD